MPIIHPIPPIYRKDSRVLVLGSFPSVKSREEGFFYAHPQNRFWRVLAEIFGEEAPASVPEKKAFLLKYGIALWDVVSSCEVTGSSDSSIKNVVPNDLSPILSMTKLTKIFTNGKTAQRLYEKYAEDKTGIRAVCLPSTSPANAAFSLDRLCEAWSVITEA